MFILYLWPIFVGVYERERKKLKQLSALKNEEARSKCCWSFCGAATLAPNDICPI
jgi:hypothetical protein